jgi:glycine cleavage system aminomethyltransferase T
VGGPGYELYVPVEMTRHVYLALMNAGQDLGLRAAGYYALDALRIEDGRRAWGAELGPDETPFEAGLEFAVKLDKPGFIGREALLAARGQPLRKKLMAFVVNDPARYLWGGESIVVDGRQARADRPVGRGGGGDCASGVIPSPHRGPCRLSSYRQRLGGLRPCTWGRSTARRRMCGFGAGRRAGLIGDGVR